MEDLSHISIMRLSKAANPASSWIILFLSSSWLLDRPCWLTESSHWSGRAAFPTGWSGRAAFPSHWSGRVAFPTGWSGRAAFPTGWSGRAAFPTGWSGRAAFPGGTSVRTIFLAGSSNVSDSWPCLFLETISSKSSRDRKNIWLHEQHGKLNKQLNHPAT
jgi:hypothetical protein